MRVSPWWLLALILIALRAATGATDAADAPRDSSLRRQALTVLAEHFDADGPGAVVALARGGKPLLLVAYGRADIESGAALTSASVFDLASVSKQFTAAAILLLEADGQVQLDAPVRRYLPDFAVAVRGREVTVADLVHHVSGLADYTGDEFTQGDVAFARLTTESHLRWINGTKARRAPGRRFEYNNSGYVLLALIVERVSGQSYTQFVTERLFRPAGMTRTQVLDRLKKRIGGAVSGYTTEDDEPVPSSSPSQITGDGNIFTSVDDLLAWCRALDANRILSKAAKRQMWTNGELDSGEPIDDDGDGYGFGWWINPETRYAFHTGSWSGTSTYVAYDPDQDLWVIVLSNDEDADVGAVADALSALVSWSEDLSLHQM